MTEVSVSVTGQHYADNKHAFKAILSEFELKWTGNYAANNYTWQGKAGNVRNEYQRNVETDTNISVKITYRGKNEKIKQRLFTWAAPGLYTAPKNTEEDLLQLDGEFRQRLVNLHREINANLLGTGTGAKVWYKLTIKEWLHQRRELSRTI